MRIVFMGTPEFAIPSLQILVDNGYDVCAVVTQPDKPKGRGNKVSMSAVKEFALDKNILVIQPNNAKSLEFLEELRSLKPDLFVTAAYGKILIKDVLDVPILGCINVHGSLLPKYRGAGPIQWAVINGELKTGITTMFTDVGVDTGDILLKEEVDIPPGMTFGELHDILKEVGSRVLLETIKLLSENKLTRIVQDNKESSYAPMMKKETGKIDWNSSALRIHNLVRGVNPWPLAYTYYKSSKMRVWKTIISTQETKNVQNGNILKVSKDGILVATDDFAINILEIQFDGSRKMTVSEYLCGHKIDEGEILESEL